MCGIFGIVFKDNREDLGRILLQAGRGLSYRGYDSVGAAAFRDQAIELKKDVGEIEAVNAKLHFDQLSGSKGIVQLRWATFGHPSVSNAQPHFDCSQNLVGAHNGNIVNTRELIREWTGKGHVFRGENDGEVVVHTVEESLKSARDLGEAIRKADTFLKGDYAYVLSARGSDRMFCVKKYSSLYMGMGDSFVCCSSDIPSLLPLTKRIVPIYDGEYVEFGWDRYQVRRLATGDLVGREPYTCTLDVEQAQKGEFDHFMLKEIHEQPEKTQALLRFVEEAGAVREYCRILLGSSMAYLIGSGSSYNACVLGAYYLNKLAGLPAIPVVAGAFKEMLGETRDPRAAYVLVSQSGETKDLINVLNYLEDKAAPKIMALVNVIGSSLELRVKHSLPLLSNIETSVPATKTFTNQALMFLALALEMARLQEKEWPGLRDDLAKLPSLIRQTIAAVEEPCRRMARELARKDYLYYLGYGISHGACLEAALKMKEVTYIPCEGMYSSEFKHGPLAIIKPDDYVLFLSTIEDGPMTLSHINEVSCRWGKVITIAPEDPSLAMNSHVFVPLPDKSYFLAPILQVIVAQLLAYSVSREKGINPDQPRNISKTLTVD